MSIHPAAHSMRYWAKDPKDSIFAAITGKDDKQAYNATVQARKSSHTSKEKKETQEMAKYAGRDVGNWSIEYALLAGRPNINNIKHAVQADKETRRSKILSLSSGIADYKSDLEARVRDAYRACGAHTLDGELRVDGKTLRRDEIAGEFFRLIDPAGDPTNIMHASERETRVRELQGAVESDLEAVASRSGKGAETTFHKHQINKMVGKLWNNKAQLREAQKEYFQAIQDEKNFTTLGHITRGRASRLLCSLMGKNARKHSMDAMNIFGLLTMLIYVPDMIIGMKQRFMPSGGGGDSQQN